MPSNDNSDQSSCNTTFRLLSPTGEKELAQWDADADKLIKANEWNKLRDREDLTFSAWLEALIKVYILACKN